MFIGILLALVTEVLEAPVSAIFRVVQATLNKEKAGFPGKSVAIDLLVRRRIPEVFSSSTVTYFGRRCDPTRVMVSSFLKFLDHTQRRTTVGRTPLDE